MTNRPRTIAALACLLVLLVSGCVPSSAPSNSPTAASPTGPDFTQPGAASAMAELLLSKAGNDKALMVEITKETVQVSVLDAADKPVTWAYRNGELGQVSSDLAYVDQATFDVSGFNISDVGALFRGAAGVSGSEEDQSLTIVDYSGGEVMMSVSTVPESQTVFFNPGGSLLETLNFDAPGGVARGIEQAIGARIMVYSVSLESDQGAWVDFPGDQETTVRRTRTSKVPVTTYVRPETVDLPLFGVARVNPDAIWKAVDAVRGTSEIPEEAKWSVMIDDRARLGVPRMYFNIGSKSMVTDLAGNLIS